MDPQPEQEASGSDRKRARALKKVQVILSPEAKSVYDDLKDKSILAAIDRKVALIRENPHYGQPVAKRLIPDKYKKYYGITNLFRVELPQFWRMLYTLTNDGEIEIIAFIIEIRDHKEYNKGFGYR